MRCHICNTDNNINPCQHYSAKLKKGDVVLIIRSITHSTEKSEITRVVSGINQNETFWADDNIVYFNNQVKENLTNKIKI